MDIASNRSWMGSSRPTRGLLRDIIYMGFSALAAGLGVSALLVLLILSLSLATPVAHAAETETMRPSDATSGSFLVRVRPSGTYVQSPTLATDVAIKVSGMVARVTVSQQFHNASQEWVEGIYVFPLPENAAVDRLRMKVGERIIDGQIREREQARAQYEAARQAGKRASLIEQERPNIFTSSVANLGPGETLMVEIEYQQTLQYHEDAVSLRFPTVVAPRYIPGSMATGQSGSGWSPDTDQVPDASRITPHVVAKGEAKRNPITIKVKVDAGFPLAAINSTYHAAKIDRHGDSGFDVSLGNGPVPADRDFELTWKAQPGALPRSALYREDTDSGTHFLLNIIPPAGDLAGMQRMPREVVYVIDTSGSMHGGSLEQAKRALLLALKQMQSGDRFNVIQFNSSTSLLFDQSRPADEANLVKARRYVERLEATGGTEMASALQAALDGQATKSHIRQVVFMTDGAVGNEDHLFRLIQQKLGQTRLFTVGIGSAPNSHFMTKSAQLGRGSFTYIGDLSEVGDKMNTLFARLEHPVMSDVELIWPRGVIAETWPQRVPDLYLGEPLVVSARVVGKVRGKLRVRGQRNEELWEASLDLSKAVSGSGMGVLWARRKVESLMDALHDGADPQQIRNDVIDLALDHSLVTRYTSLVAVDITPVRPADRDLNSQSVPTNLPAGWDHDKVFGELPQTATPAMLHLLLALLAAAGAFAFRTRRWS